LLAADGFGIHRNDLVIEPVDDLLKGFCFDRSDNVLYVHLFIQPLYIPSQYRYLSYGWRLKRDNFQSMFFLDEEHIEDSISEISRLLVKEKHWLLDTKTVTDFYHRFLISDLKIMQNKSGIDIRYDETLTYTRAYLHPQAACSYVDQFLTKWTEEGEREGGWVQEVVNTMHLLQQVCESKEKVEELFDQWKQFTATNLNIKIG
jgi:hypothetical protein